MAERFELTADALGLLAMIETIGSWSLVGRHIIGLDDLTLSG